MADNIGDFSSSTANTAAVTASATGAGPGSNGIHAMTSSNADSAVYGQHTGDGIGIFGRGGINAGEGVFGQAGSDSSGVFGNNGAHGYGVQGLSFGEPGVYGKSINGIAGVHGEAGMQAIEPGEPGNLFTVGVLGISDLGAGVAGSGTNGVGTSGVSQNNNGVEGHSESPSSAGVLGTSKDGAGIRGIGNNVGLHAYNNQQIDFNPTGPGVNHAYLGTRSTAGDFYGNVVVHGHLTKSSGSFVIDHPLDPANKLLSHSLVESPDMKNIYDGVTKLDSNGNAVVSLPEWFEAANSDFRYQLTGIGAASPNLHIAKEISDAAFSIAGGQPNGRVSWQVTGIRKDAYALANPLQVEKEKTEAERGSYLHPEAHGEPASKGVRHKRYQAHKDEQPRLTAMLKSLRKK